MFSGIRNIGLKVQSLFVKKSGAASPLPYQPYKEDTIDLEYNKLFCDNPELFRPSGKPEGVWKKIYAKTPFVEDLKAIAEDAHIDTRTRMLAFNELRSHSVIATKEVLGVVIEVGGEEGLETIAVYKDLSVKYINAKSKLFASNNADTNDINEKVQGILSVSQKIIGQAERSTEPRQAPPAAEEFRITFLAADGFYTGQGNIADIENDPVAKALVFGAGSIMIALTKGTEKLKPEVPEKTSEKTVDSIPVSK